MIGIAQLLLCVEQVAAHNPTLPVAGSWPKQSLISQATVEARDLPVDRYVRLRTLALSGASAHLGPRIKNPRLSDGGLEPAVLAILEQQRAYLQTHLAVAGGTGELGQAPQPQHSAMLGSGLLGAGLPPSSCFNPTITVVNGRAAGAVFTPHLPDNHYLIEGCGFGDKPGEIQLESGSRVLWLSPRQPIALQLDGPAAWSDRTIGVHLDSHLSGVPDLAVILVVRLADGRRAEMRGCRFVAARGEPTFLKTVPASWVKLNATTASSRAIHQLEYLSPARGDEVPRDPIGMSALVIRSDQEVFLGASDSYEFSALNPGWVVESIQIQNYSITCPGDVTRAEQTGTWNATFDVHQFTVTWASNSCVSFLPPIFRFAMSASQYGVKVWAIGPIGTDPVGHDFLQHNQKRD